MSKTTVMTIGQLSRRGGVPAKTIRRYDSLGLLYTRGRGEGNYRLYDESTLWCLRVVKSLRSLGFTLREVRDIVSTYVSRPDSPIGPVIAGKLRESRSRVEKRIAELQSVRDRIREFQSSILPRLRKSNSLLDDPQRTA